MLILVNSISTLVFEICASAHAKDCGSMRNYRFWRASSLVVFGLTLLGNFPVAVLQLAFIAIWPGDLAVWRVIIQILYESIIEAFFVGPACWLFDLCM